MPQAKGPWTSSSGGARTPLGLAWRARVPERDAPSPFTRAARVCGARLSHWAQTATTGATRNAHEALLAREREDRAVEEALGRVAARLAHPSAWSGATPATAEPSTSDDDPGGRTGGGRVA